MPKLLILVYTGGSTTGPLQEAPRVACVHARCHILATFEAEADVELADFITVRHCTEVRPGEIEGLNRPCAKHFMIAGPEGAIVTEYATFHDNDGLRFTNPAVEF